jgi:hypothetical protein
MDHIPKQMHRKTFTNKTMPETAHTVQESGDYNRFNYWSCTSKGTPERTETIEQKLYRQIMKLCTCKRLSRFSRPQGVAEIYSKHLAKDLYKLVQGTKVLKWVLRKNVEYNKPIVLSQNIAVILGRNKNNRNLYI